MNVLSRKADDQHKFAKYVAALVRSRRLTANDGWMLSRAIRVHVMAGAPNTPRG